MRVLLLALPIALAACTDIPPGPPPMGSLSGTITGTNLGPLSGVTVTATWPGQAAVIADSTTTGNHGGYAMAGVPTGGGSITLSGIPAACQPAAAASFSVSASATTIVNIQLSCSRGPPTGTVTGTVTSSLGGGIANAQGARLPIATAAATQSGGGC